MSDPTCPEEGLRVLRATPQSVQWGYFDGGHPPVLEVGSGDSIMMECLTHHGGDAPDLMMDEGLREIYESIGEEERGPGTHLLTGPIHVEGARAGDTLECKVLDLEPRLPYGSNFQANWGLLYEDLCRREVVTIYRARLAEGVARPLFSYPLPDSPRKTPGRILSPESVARESAPNEPTVPLRMHLGIAGVAPSQEGPVSTIPPGSHGGNVDNREFAAETTMYYPVFRPGAMFWAGDPHFAQGDGEISGTAIEAHLNATLRLTVRKDFPLLQNPVLETPERWICHGFHQDLDECARLAALEMIHLLQNLWGLSHQEAYSLLSVAADFRITQVVNRTKGVHVAIPKGLL